MPVSLGTWAVLGVAVLFASACLAGRAPQLRGRAPAGNRQTSPKAQAKPPRPSQSQRKTAGDGWGFPPWAAPLPALTHQYQAA